MRYKYTMYVYKNWDGKLLRKKGSNDLEYFNKFKNKRNYKIVIYYDDKVIYNERRMNMYVGEFEDFETKTKEELISEYGITEGLAIYIAVQSVKTLEYGSWEHVRKLVHEALVDYVNE